MEFGEDKRLRCLQVLNLQPGASNDEIRKAYKSMALKYHPDKNPSSNANKTFQEISAAYNCLMQGGSYLERMKRDDVNTFEFIFRNLFTWFMQPESSYEGAFRNGHSFSSFNFDDDDDYIPSYARPTSPPSAATSNHRYDFTRANSQHGQYFHEAKQAKQSGKSAKKVQKDARRTRRGSSPSETPERETPKEASPSSQASIKPENQPVKKSKRQLRFEQKQKDQALSDIRQQLEIEEEKKKRKSEERRMAQEQRKMAEREAQEEERKQEEERIKVVREAEEKKMEEERKCRAEQKRRAELMKNFESNEFLSASGDFLSKSSDILNIIKTDLSSDSPKGDGEKVESINGIPVADLARLQNGNLNGDTNKAGNQRKHDVQGSSPKNVSADPPSGTRREHRSGSRHRQNRVPENYIFGNRQFQTSHAPMTQSVNHNCGQSQPQYHQQQQQPRQQFQGQRQQTLHFNRSINMQPPHPRAPQTQGPTMAPMLPPPQLNRPPPPLRFLYPSFPRPLIPNCPPTQSFPNQFRRMNAA